MKRNYKWACSALAVLLAFSSVAISGCQEKDVNETDVSDETTEASLAADKNISDDEADPSPSEKSKKKDPDKANSEISKDYSKEALDLAQKVGLSPEDLRGEYEYFLQFAETVDGNPALYEYEGYVYQLFPLIADQIDEENKEYFLEQLTNLVIEEGDPDINASAYYSDVNNYIMIGGWTFNAVEEDASLTVYHELIHFVDASIDGSEANVAIMNDGSVKSTDELTEDELADVKQYVSSSSFTEGGAEHYVSKYFGNTFSAIDYQEVTSFMFGLEYIIGTERFDDLFYDSNTTLQVFNLFEEYGFTDDEIVKLLKGLDQLKDSSTSIPQNEMMNPQEALVRLYEAEIGTDYKEDRLFCEVLADIGNNGHFNNIAPYPRAFTTEMIDDWKQIVADEYGVDLEDIGLMNYPKPFFDGDEVRFGTIYDVFYKKDFGRSEGGQFTFTYDFEKGEIIEYKTKVCDWVPGEVNDKLDSEDSNAAKELIESLKTDNSKAHDQNVTGADSNLKEQYQTVSELGSKYGIYFWFADLTPEGLIEEDKIATDPGKISDALSEIEEVLELYPEDYFDQLLFGNYKGFAICLYDGDHNSRLRNTYNINGDYYMIINISISDPSLEDLYGADTVRNMGFTGVSIMKTQLICEIWKCTEKFFTNYNSHFANPTKGKESWKKVNESSFTYAEINDIQIIDLIMGDHYSWDYFLCKECVSFKITDRTLLYEYVMLSKITGTPTDLTPECEAKVNEICDEIRYYFDTDNWPGDISWENV